MSRFGLTFVAWHCNDRSNRSPTTISFPRSTASQVRRGASRLTSSPTSPRWTSVVSTPATLALRCSCTAGPVCRSSRGRRDNAREDGEASYGGLPVFGHSEGDPNREQDQQKCCTNHESCHNFYSYIYHLSHLLHEWKVCTRRKIWVGILGFMLSCPVLAITFLPRS